MHIPPLIHDLALMLLVAGIVTLIFKKLKQPLVLGYIIAGLLVGPYIGWFPAVTDATSIEAWSEIGIIILMFSLGLEFNLLKLFSVGKTAFITAATEVLCMFLIGFLCGNILGWTTMSRVFLGCMLSMSSTTIIIKAFDDLKLKGEQFTESVFGTLIIEDIAGILMMVIFSTMAVSQGISGGEMTVSLLKMAFYLALWLILGILIIPTFIKKVKNLMSDETLMIVSIGICFGMVLLSHYLGFSSALGAFLAGSLLAGTELNGRIESVTKSNKDLFGAVFFISIGMMVDPGKILPNIGVIVLLTLVIILGQLLFSTVGSLLSGKPLKEAIKCGFSFAQIGEFSFIIAALGISLGLIDTGIYPIIVTVSVITTFTTPYIIKSADPVYNFLNIRLPEALMEKLDRTNIKDVSRKETEGPTWSKFLKTYLVRFGIQLIVLAGIILGGIYILWPFLMSVMNNEAASIISTVSVIVCSAPFLKQTSVQRNRFFTALWFKKKKSHIILMLFSLLSLAVTITFVAYPAWIMLGMDSLPLTLLTIAVVAVITYSDGLMGLYQKIEKTFLRNLGIKISDKKDFTKKLPGDYKVARFYNDQLSPVFGRSLRNMMGEGKQSIRVIRVDRGGKQLHDPRIRRRLTGGDAVYIAGPKKDLDRFFMNKEITPDGEYLGPNGYISLEDFIKENSHSKKHPNGKKHVN